MRRPIWPAIVLLIALLLPTRAAVGLVGGGVDPGGPVGIHAVDHRAPNPAPVVPVAVLVAALAAAGRRWLAPLPAGATPGIRRTHRYAGASLRAPPAG